MSLTHLFLDILLPRKVIFLIFTLSTHSLVITKIHIREKLFRLGVKLTNNNKN